MNVSGVALDSFNVPKQAISPTSGKTGLHDKLINTCVIMCYYFEIAQ